MSTYFNINWLHILDVLLLPLFIQLVSLLIGIFINRLINKQMVSYLVQKEAAIPYVCFNAVRGIPVAWCSGIGLYWSITMLDMTPRLQALLSKLLLGIILLTITRVAARIIVGMVEYHTSRSDNRLPKTSLLTNILTIIIYSIGILIILQSYGISITPILTAVGVGGMALALGLQETLSNVFAGITLILSRQIRIDDFIKLSSGEEGQVSDITWRFTTIHTKMNTVVVIPNQKISAAVLTNYNMPQQELCVVIPLGVSYDSDLDKVEQVTLAVAAEVMAQINTVPVKPPSVQFCAFGESSIDLKAILHCGHYSCQALLTHAFIKEITRRYREANIEIPFPVRTLNLKEAAVLKGKFITEEKML